MAYLLFKSCEVVTRNNLALTLFLLPHVALQILSDVRHQYSAVIEQVCFSPLIFSYFLPMGNKSVA